MKRLPVLFMIIFLVSGCDSLQGEKGEQGFQGSTGPQGIPGKNLVFTVFEGTLAPGDPEYWIFKTSLDLQRCIIFVRVTLVVEFIDTWIEPTWMFGDEDISIFNDEFAGSDHKYRIIIASEPE